MDIEARTLYVAELPFFLKKKPREGPKVLTSNGEGFRDRCTIRNDGLCR
jgi:hypothetical protein